MSTLWFVKPIFHCNMKPLSLGVRVGRYPQRETVTLPISTCWDLKMLADPMRPPTRTNNAHREHIMPNVSPNASQWNMVRGWYARVGFALGMYILCCLCQFRSRWVPNTNPFFMWNMRLNENMQLHVREHNFQYIILFY